MSKTVDHMIECCEKVPVLEAQIDRLQHALAEALDTIYEMGKVQMYDAHTAMCLLSDGNYYSSWLVDDDAWASIEVFAIADLQDWGFDGEVISEDVRKEVYVEAEEDSEDEEETWTE